MPKRPTHFFALTAVVAVVGAACGSVPAAEPGVQRSTQVVTRVVTSLATAEEPAAQNSSPAGEPAEDPSTELEADGGGAGSATMPDVVCMNLQAAQDKIQEAGVFYSRSSDATGKGRRQVLDRNWIVVGQSPQAGATVREGEAVLSVVKEGEDNPC